MTIEMSDETNDHQDEISNEQNSPAFTAAKVSKKKKGTKMTLGAFLEVDKTSSWADEMDEYSMPTVSVESYSSASHNAPTPSYASRNDAPMSRPTVPFPTVGPWKAFVANLSFSATEQDISSFFSGHGCSVKAVRIQIDREEKRPKGFCYVEFQTADDLRKAITLEGESLSGRRIRVSIAESSSKGLDADRTVNDWRSSRPAGPLPPVNRDRQGAREYRPPRDGEFRGFGPRDSARMGSSQNDNTPMERKRLNLTPRNLAPDTNSTATASETSKPRHDPFGGAKPREATPNDYLADPVLERRPSVTASETKSRPRLDPFGGAKPREEVISKRKSQLSSDSLNVADSDSVPRSPTKSSKNDSA